VLGFEMSVPGTLLGAIAMDIREERYQFSGFPKNGIWKRRSAAVNDHPSKLKWLL
jgi:hypothetical protein